MQPGSRRTHLFGSAMTWLTAGALAINLLLVAGLIGLVGARGLGHFWPLPIERLELDDGRIFMGEIWNREPLPSGEGTRVRIKTGNRDVTGSDFVWVDETRVTRRDLPHDVGLLERLEWGAFHGFPVELRRGEEVLARTPDEIWRALPDLLDVKQGVRERLRRLEKREIDDVNRAMTQLRVDARALEREGGEAARDSREMHEIEADRAEYQARYEELVAELRALEAELSAESLRMRTPQGQIRDIAVGHIVRAVPANRLSLADRLGVYVSRLREFLLDDPRESNTARGSVRARGAYSGEQPRRRPLDRLRRVRAGLLRVRGGRHARPALLRRPPADAHVRHGRHPLGEPHAGSADRARRHRIDRGRAGGRAAARPRGVAGAGGDEVRDAA
jgi:phosphate transport system permease protein